MGLFTLRRPNTIEEFLVFSQQLKLVNPEFFENIILIGKVSSGIENCMSKLDCGLMLLAGHEWMVDWLLFCTNFTTIQSWCTTNILEQLQMVQNPSHGSLARC
ncbi:hypothetical protein GBA52_010590 [Prunus armeniaca]|nr:hypothetical protein GBA52_010590 [Prunus armeniaca]